MLGFKDGARTVCDLEGRGVRAVFVVVVEVGDRGSGVGDMGGEGYGPRA